METDEKNRLFSLLMNEISITSGLRERWHGYARLWVTVLITSLFATISLSGAAQIGSAFIFLYALLMIYDVHIRERRAGKVEEAMRGLVLREEFGLFHPERIERDTFSCLAEMIRVRRQLLPTNIEDLRGDKDIVRIFEECVK